MLSVFLGIVLVVLALVDSFEAMILPRRITRRLRPARLFLRSVWLAWRRLAALLPAGPYRQNLLSVFGPLSLLSLFACWIASLILGFALIQWGGGMLRVGAALEFRECLYHSGETFFTLGYGDVTPQTYGGKLFAVVEAGTGFGFMAIVIGYLPVLYQAFSRREQMITLLDARAGSPPTAAELLRRFGGAAGREMEANPEIARLLAEWELWAADLLESHLSFPILVFYRSQHDNQSWLAALACTLDASALALTVVEGTDRRQARLTFAMARHAAVDLGLVFRRPPKKEGEDRLPQERIESLCAELRKEGAVVRDDEAALTGLRELMALYEPFCKALSLYFDLPLPAVWPEGDRPDNWQTSAWMRRAAPLTGLGLDPRDEHFD